MDADTQPGQIHEFQQQLGVLVEDANYCLDAARERKDEEQLHSLLVPVVEGLLFDSGDVFDNLAPLVSKQSDEALAALSIPRAFVDIQSTTRASLARVQEIEADADALEVIEPCVIAAGQLRQSVLDLELRLAQVIGVAPALGHRTYLEEGLNLRRHYFRFERATSGLAPLENRIGLAKKLVGNFEASKFWPTVRVVDQIRCSRLSRELAEADGQDDEALWNLLRAFAVNLRGISSRRELIDHDVELIGDLLDGDVRQSLTASIDETFLKRVEPLRYVFDEFEGLFQRGTSVTFGAWKFQLETARDRLLEPTEFRTGRTTAEMPGPGETIKP